MKNHRLNGPQPPTYKMYITHPENANTLMLEIPRRQGFRLRSSCQGAVQWLVKQSSMHCAALFLVTPLSPSLRADLDPALEAQLLATNARA